MSFPFSHGSPADLAFSLLPQATLLGVGRGLESPVCLHPGTHGCTLGVLFETSQDST